MHIGCTEWGVSWFLRVNLGPVQAILNSPHAAELDLGITLAQLSTRHRHVLQREFFLPPSMGKDGVVLVAVTGELVDFKCTGIEEPHSDLLLLSLFGVVTLKKGECRLIMIDPV